MGLWPVSTHSQIWESTPMILTWCDFVPSSQLVTYSRMFNTRAATVYDELSRVYTTDVFIDVKSRRSGAGPGPKSSICFHGSSSARDIPKRTIPSNDVRLSLLPQLLLPC